MSSGKVRWRSISVAMISYLQDSENRQEIRMKEELQIGIKPKLLREQVLFYTWVRSLKSEQEKNIDDDEKSA